MGGSCCARPSWGSLVGVPWVAWVVAHGTLRAGCVPGRSTRRGAGLAWVSTHRTIAGALKGQRQYGRVCPTLPTAIRAVDARAKGDSMLDASRDLTEQDGDLCSDG